MTIRPTRSPERDTGGRRVPVLLLAAVYVVALGGRFTLDRVGLPDLEKVDLRLLGGGAVAIGMLFWCLHPRTRERHAFTPSLRWALALFALTALSAAWSPPGAAVVESLLDIGALAVLVVATAVLTAPDPARGAQVLVYLTVGFGVLYAALGLLTGQTDVQGRTAILGGGPNVYVRVVCLGIIAAIAVAVTRRAWVVWLVPVMGVAALLSGSRGGIAAAVISAVVFLVVFRRRWTGGWVARVFAVCGVGAAVGMLVAGARIGALVQDRVVGELSGTTDYSERPGLLDQAWRLFAEHPLIGNGLDGFWVRYGGSVDLEYPHNVVAEIAVTTGLVGLAVFAVFLVQVVTDGRARVPLTTEQIALVIGAVYVLAESMFSGDFYDTRFFWMFAVAAVNVPSWTPLVTTPAEPTPPTPVAAGR